MEDHGMKRIGRANVEVCCRCGSPTGRIGRRDDSLFVDGEGPFCDECYDKAGCEAGSFLATPMWFAKVLDRMNAVANRHHIGFTDEAIRSCVRSAAVRAGINLPTRLTLMPLVESFGDRQARFSLLFYEEIVAELPWPPTVTNELFHIAVEGAEEVMEVGD